MHEFSVAQSLVEIVQEAADREGMNPVQVVHVRVGRLTCLDPQALAMAYQLLTEKSPLASSRLEVQRIEPRAACRDCGLEYDFPEDFGASCPECGSASTEMVQGKEMTVDSIEGEVNNGD